MQTIDCYVEKKTFPPVNRCIYCGETKEPLQDEHIIPFGLNGELVLQRASCISCAKITSTFERSVLRTMLGEARIHLGMRTRRPKKRPTQLATRVKTDQGFARRIVSIADHPHVFTLLELPPPSTLGRTGGIKQGHIRVWFRSIQDTSDRVRRLGGQTKMKSVIPVHEFGRLIAKIAHSYAVAILGLEAFDPILPDLILGRKDTVFEFVGGPDEVTEFPKDKELLHQLILSKNFNPKRVDLHPIIIADICLFSCFNAPIYQAVVGRDKVGGMIPLPIAIT